MPASLTSDESYSVRTFSSNLPSSTSTAASSRATSPLPINKPAKRRPSITRYHTTAGNSLSPPQQAILSRVLAEEDKAISRLRDQISELAAELRVRTDALESAYERIQSTDKRIVETHQKYLAEVAARASAESNTRRAQEETRRVQALLDVAQHELKRSKSQIEHLEADKADAESAAGRARAVARELKQTIRVNKARDSGASEARIEVEEKPRKAEAEEKPRKEEMAAALKQAYERGKAEGEASATVKALAAFDKLMESDELDGYDDKAKLSTRQEIKDSSKQAEPKTTDPGRTKSPSPLRRGWSIKRTQS